jgi:hypothetical protein
MVVNVLAWGHLASPSLGLRPSLRFAIAQLSFGFAVIGQIVN